MLRFPDAVLAPNPDEVALRTTTAGDTMRWMLGGSHISRPGTPPVDALRSLERRAIPPTQSAAADLQLHPRYGDLLDAIYATVGTPSHWPVVLDRISEVVGADQTFLLTDDGDPRMPSAIANSESDPEALRQFLNYYASINIFAEPADRAFRAGETRFSHWVVADSDLERTEFYQDFFRRFDMYYSFGIKVATPEGRSLSLSCQRARSRCAFTPAEGQTLQSLRPHLKRAFQLQQQAVSSSNEVQGMMASINAFGHAIFGVDRKGKVTFCTEQAKHLAGTASILEIRNGHLRCVLPEQAELIQQLIDAATRIPGVKMPSKTVHKTNGDPVQITASALPGAGRGSSSAVAIYLSDPGQAPPARTRLLIDAFRLTPIETRLCQALLCGLSVKETSDLLHITQSTCRFHLKSIFTKTGVRRQQELVLLLASLPAA